jgi:hypothetical protein
MGPSTVGLSRDGRSAQCCSKAAVGLEDGCWWAFNEPGHVTNQILSSLDAHLALVLILIFIPILIQILHARSRWAQHSSMPAVGSHRLRRFRRVAWTPCIGKSSLDPASYQFHHDGVGDAEAGADMAERAIKGDAFSRV